jgi:hypothetical protein
MAIRGPKRRLVLEAEYWRLLGTGVGTVEACRIVGTGRKTGYRCRAEQGGGPLIHRLHLSRLVSTLILAHRRRRHTVTHSAITPDPTAGVSGRTHRSPQRRPPDFFMAVDTDGDGRAVFEVVANPVWLSKAHEVQDRQEAVGSDGNGAGSWSGRSSIFAIRVLSLRTPVCGARQLSRYMPSWRWG